MRLTERKGDIKILGEGGKSNDSTPCIGDIVTLTVDDALPIGRNSVRVEITAINGINYKGTIVQSDLSKLNSEKHGCKIGTVLDFLDKNIIICAKRL